MERSLKLKCLSCGHWNRVPVNKIFIEQNSPKPKLRVMIPMYKPLEISRCGKCGKSYSRPKSPPPILISNSRKASENSQ